MSKTAKKYVYFFGNGKADGRGDMKGLLGGKGAGLAEMTNLRVPVPAGFTITTEACNEYFKNKKKYPQGMWEHILTNLKKTEKAMGMKFGDHTNPLLVSVRSGAKFSMPGMMDTVLNLGLNDTTMKALIKKTKNDRFAYDAYRRFITMFGNIVMGVDRQKFERALEEIKERKGVHLDTDLTAADLKGVVDEFKVIYKRSTGENFPSDPYEQLKKAINAVFSSWFGDRAVKYRKLNNIPENLGTACNVQAMVFGNMGENSGTGVGFTRDPSTGQKRFFAECLINAQGEDVVAGIRTPLHISELKKRLPKAYNELDRIYKKLEKHYRDMLDIEFTVQEGKLYMLQTRVGKRTAAAALRTAIDMVKERLIDKRTAILRIDPQQLDQLLHPTIDPKAKVSVIAKGLPASPGAAVGKVIFTPDEAEKAAEKGEKVILVRTETSPEDIGGMHAAQGILTARGGMTSHAAVVARGMGKCCVAGCGAININESQRYFTVNTFTVKEGDYITLNGTRGEVILGEAPLIMPELTGDFGIFMKWVDGFRKIGVRANADTPHDAKVARNFGSQGIGLCRTEHMFFEPERIFAVREMILADDTEGRQKALAKLLPMQKGDFIGIFKEMKGLPVTIRLLDPPLHEFIPHTDEELKALAHQMEVPFDKLKTRNKALHEFNPMLGHRGCRLGITYPEIYAMQTQAIIEAACELAKQRVKIIPEIMIPLVAHVNELKMMRELVIKVADDVQKKYKIKINYTVGTMIELPRAAITADEIAAYADFFSFGTNDLTQTTFGLSRDDAGRFLPFYVEKGILEDDPFITLDQGGTGLMIKIAIEKGRKVKKGLKMGICGEHGGDPKSIEFCHKVGLDYVSCSPYRVPIARLAGAQAALKEKTGGKDLSKSTV
ncbi:MAG: pyruvate, phosphate dikinase [Nitrospirae bacterium CG_4_10_14_3_um_filter_44_29]|nr:pyruvate, phosphate dikinase [Nitrospirota bacterium]OIO29711.1 MAG: pyruvate, phosphate dikinase [Nitrospirae bacterium CG1_02_44_142]PIP70691.1 MAG: pyruvate, phosphate dikinase [Nitrospirae bacterium CG22_combo_CG10-13_8_21_14_all_44_11]PIV43128.1 MAG: pyruvate, phosphate dikinase [Nitrospirae bacterium CG02_land_8_20_14_3_00_44_33]PIV66335.1 MAG: pyruvate, phosphate dikinase [Nitrospirae bacterium CG01_land_8_20_14_3_00_44_22]PIW90728.1 MAG: pyruvate, phosphate dikinase [Nitrospirae bac